MSRKAAVRRCPGGSREGAEEHQGGSGTRFRRSCRIPRGAALPQLRRADRVREELVHRVRRVRRHLPDGLHHVTMNGDEADLRTRLKAPAENTAQALYVSEPLRTNRVMVKDEDVCPALRSVRRALPDGGVGHAEVPHRDDPRGPGLPHTATRSRLGSVILRNASCTHRPHDSSFAPCVVRRGPCSFAKESRVKPITAVNDFVVKFANVNGSGSASANELFAKSILRMGVPVSPRNIFPSNIQGLPTWYEGAGQRARLARAARRRRSHGRDESADVGCGSPRDRAPAAISSTTTRAHFRRRSSAKTFT